MAEKVTVHIGNLKIDAVEACVDVCSSSTQHGIPMMDAPIVMARGRFDLDDEKNIDNQKIQQLYELSTEQKKKDRIKKMKLEFWTDLSKENATVSYEFNGWLSGLKTANVVQTASGNGRTNHYLEFELTMDSTEGNFRAFRVGN
jgi:hypothetical protein